MSSFLEIMGLWPSDDDLALDLGFKYSKVLKWRVRAVIAPDNWPALLAAAERRGYPLTLQILMHCWEKRGQPVVRPSARRRHATASIA